MNQVQQQETQNSVELTRTRGQHEREVASLEQARELDALRSQQALQQAGNEAALVEARERNRAANALLEEANDLRLKAAQQNGSQQLALSEVEQQLVLEQTRAPLLRQLDTNGRVAAQTAGAAAGIEVGKHTEEYLSTLKTEVPELTERVSMYKMLRELQSLNDTTSNLAGGSANLIVSPDSVGLNLGSYWNRTEL